MSFALMSIYPPNLGCKSAIMLMQLAQQAARQHEKAQRKAAEMATDIARKKQTAAWDALTKARAEVAHAQGTCHECQSRLDK